MNTRLKQKDFDVLTYIIVYKSANDGIPPSVREIMVACDISSTSQVNSALLRLAVAHKIDFIGGNNVSRSIKVIGGRWSPPSVVTP